MTSASQATNSDGSEKKLQSKKMIWVKRIFTTALFILVPIFLFMLIKNVNWHEVKEALQNLQLKMLLLGLGVALTSYCVYGSYDVLGRKYSGHSLPVRQ